MKGGNLANMFAKNYLANGSPTIQAEPYLHSGMGQVSFYQEALKIFFSWGVDFKR